jgi:tetratricopeptide (TPR) repeat protein
VKLFSVVLNRDAHNVVARLNRGNAYYDLNEPESILAGRRDYLILLHQFPDCVPAQVSLGHCLHKAGNAYGAWRSFMTALLLSPNDQQALHGRAAVNVDVGNRLGAMADVSAALLRCAPAATAERARLLSDRGVVHLKMNDTAYAVKDFREAIALDPKCHSAYFNLANLYFGDKQWKLAVKYYDKSIDAQPHLAAAALLNRGIAHVSLGEVEAALADFDRVSELEPRNAAAFFNRGNVARLQQEFKTAAVQYEQSVRLCDLDAGARVSHAQVLGAGKHYSQEAHQQLVNAFFIQDARDQQMRARPIDRAT